MKGLVRGPLLVGGLGPGPHGPPLKSGPDGCATAVDRDGETDRPTDRRVERQRRVEWLCSNAAAATRLNWRHRACASSDNKSSTSSRRRRAATTARARLFAGRAWSPRAWQRKIALNTAQMETKSRPKDAHRGIGTRSLFSRRRAVDCSELGSAWRCWLGVRWEPYRDVLRVAYITVLSCHCTWLAYTDLYFTSPLLLRLPTRCRCQPVLSFFLPFFLPLHASLCVRMMRLESKYIRGDINIKVSTTLDRRATHA